MIFVFVSLLTIIPVILILGVWDHHADRWTEMEGDRNRVLYLLGIASLMLAYYAFSSHILIDGNYSVLALFLFPAYLGVVALVLLRWRELLAVWRQEKRLFTIAVLVPLGLLGLICVGARSLLPLFILAGPPALAAILWDSGRQVPGTALAIVSLILGVLLLLDAIGLVANPALMSSSLRSVYASGMYLVGFASLIVAALLLVAPTPRSLHYLAPVGFVLLALAASEVRHGLLAKATGRAAEDNAPLVLIVLAILTGMQLAGLPRQAFHWRRIAYLVLVPALIAGGYTLGWLVNPQAITEARAAALNQAIERYYEDSGVYPAGLSNLVPAYVPYLLGPLTGRGQVWCYQSGPGYFRLGYVLFQRYYGPTYHDPHWEIRVPASEGSVPGGSWMCDYELEKYKPTLGL